MYEYEGGKWSPSRMITVLQVNVIAFIFTSGFGQMIVYIVRIRGKMGYLIIENLNLLNKMNEGLIVVDDSDFDDDISMGQRLLLNRSKRPGSPARSLRL